MLVFRSGMNRWSTTRTSVEAAGFTVAGPQDTTFNDNDVVVNWGCLTPATGGIQLNSVEGVQNCCNKIRTLELLGDVMPKVWLAYSTDIPEPFVMKKNGTHKGFGKRKVNRHTRRTEQLAQNFDVFQEWLEIQKEYRVSVLMQGKRYIIFRMYEKVKNGKPSPREIFHPSWDFQVRKLDEVDPAIRQMCLTAASTLKVHFVGFDVAVTPNGNYIIEANSAPGLGNECARKLFRKLSEQYPNAVGR